jgi:hypothetical protein
MLELSKKGTDLLINGDSRSFERGEYFTSQF